MYGICTNTTHMLTHTPAHLHKWEGKGELSWTDRHRSAALVGFPKPTASLLWEQEVSTVKAKSLIEAQMHPAFRYRRKCFWALTATGRSKEENLRREQQKLSPHSWLAMTPHTGQAGNRTSCSWRWGHSLIFTIAKECNLEFKITQINCLLKQNSALFCLGIYIIQIKKSAKKQKLCWCMRLGHCVQRRKSHVNIQYLDSMAHSEKEMRPEMTITGKRVARGIKSGVRRSWWWPGDKACVAICPISLKLCSKLLSEAIPKHWSH